MNPPSLATVVEIQSRLYLSRYPALLPSSPDWGGKGRTQSRPTEQALGHGRSVPGLITRSAGGSTVVKCQGHGKLEAAQTKNNKQ